jgi:hypothetical protein
MHRESLGPVIRVLGLVLLITWLIVKISLPRTHVSPGDQILPPDVAAPHHLAEPFLSTTETPSTATTPPDRKEPVSREEQCDAADWECFFLPMQ